MKGINMKIKNPLILLSSTLLLTSFSVANETKSYTLTCAPSKNMTIAHNRSNDTKNKLVVTFKAGKMGTAHSRLNHGECSWVDRALRANEPRKFCQYDVDDLAFTRNSNGYSLSSQKAPYVKQLRIGGKFSLKVTKKDNCLVVTKVLP